MNQVQAIVLAGGASRRLKPLTFDKNLIEFLGKPLIEWVIDNLIKAGVENIIVICNSSNFSFVSSLKKSATIKTVVQKQPKGMADAILSAGEILSSSPLLVVNGSDYMDYKIIKEVIKKGWQTNRIVLTGIQMEEYFPGGYFVVVGDQVKGLIEKPGAGQEPSNLVKLVLDYFPDGLQVVKQLKTITSCGDDIYERFLDKIIKNQTVDLVKYKGFWGYVKYPWHILEMMNVFLFNKLKAKIAKTVFVSSKATIKGEVVLEENVKVLEGAKIQGPCFIGKNTIVGNNVLIRESIIGANCVVGYNTEIARSYIGNNCWFHCNYIGDSVLEENISFGSGARTANLRLDEKEITIKKQLEKISSQRIKLGALIAKGVRVGINASLMPGVTIGAWSFVGPGVVLYQNLPAQKFCYLIPQLKIKTNRYKANLQNRKKFQKLLNG
jgi:bifunctional UDP-N-acetylglucosamine pyrophosphorylase/glucosamine-1-phosphate N-acetyltransferase